MKKHDDGYILAFVLVVVAVLTLISTAVSTIAVRNIQTQQAAVSRMKDKYMAEGTIEIVLAQLNDLSFESISGEEKALDDEIVRLCSTVPTDMGLTAVQLDTSETTFSKDNDNFVYKLIIEVQKASEAVIAYQIEVKGIIEETKIDVQSYTYMSIEEDAV